MPMLSADTDKSGFSGQQPEKAGTAPWPDTLSCWVIQFGEILDYPLAVEVIWNSGYQLWR